MNNRAIVGRFVHNMLPEELAVLRDVIASHPRGERQKYEFANRIMEAHGAKLLLQVVNMVRGVKLALGVSQKCLDGHFKAVLISAERKVGNAGKNPTTFKELRGSPTWRSTLSLLKRIGETVMVAEGEACMGRYQAVVLTGNGFQLEDGKAGMAAAYSPTKPEHTPIRATKKVVEMALKLSAPMSDDPPGTPTPTEAEIVANVLRRIEVIREKTKKS